MLCPNCGLENNGSGNFCAGCGAMLNNTQQYERTVDVSGDSSTYRFEQQPNIKKKLKKSDVIIIVAAAIVVIAALAGVIALISRDKPADITVPAGSDTSSLVSSSDMVVSDELKTAATTTATTTTAAAPRDLTFVSVQTSGNIPAAGERTYVGQNVIDKNPDTCWIVTTDNPGAAGAYIKLWFSSPQTINGIKMINGNVYRDNYYFINGHIKEFSLEFSDGTVKYFTANEIETRSLDGNVFRFDAPVTTSYIKLTVISSYIGTKEMYEKNTSMAELEAF